MGLKTEKEKNQNIQVVLRCRPLSATERKQGSYSIVDVQQDHHEVRVKERNVPNAQPRIFTFDKVFGPRAEQIDVYRTVMTPLIDEVLQGYNCTVFAYGQTGTGKTFTMEGEHTDSSTHTWESDPQAGIIPRAMHQLFTRLETQEVEFSVRVSYLEIYNEELVDLLGAEAVENPRLRIYEDISKKGSCVISGLEEMIVRSKDEVYDILNQGSRRRQTAATLMNAQSSRSHSLFMLTVHIKENNIEGEELLKIGKLNLVDLAGSECIGRSGATERRAREAGQINQSLLTLGRVITALVDHAPHVPYRESKLTRLLQDSLGGRTKTSIIATISPALSNLDETLSTLNYANTAKRITNRPEVNQKLTKRAMLKGYEEEIERLRRDLQATRDKHGVYIASENYEEMQNSIAQKTGIIKDLEEQLEIVTEIKTKLEAMFEETKEKLTITSEELKDTKQNLRVTRRDRDEQQFLVKEHVEKERDLHDEASRLLSTAEVSTDHVSRLHDKIDRKSSVEQHNEQATIQYEESLHADLSNMHKELQRMKDQYNSVTSNIQLTMGDIMDRRNQEVAVFTEDLMACKDRVVDGLTSIKSQLSAHQDQSNSWVEQHTKVTKQLLDEEIRHHVEFVNQAFVSCIEKLHQRQQHHTDKIEELSQTLKRQMDLQTLYIEKHYTEVTEQLSAHKQKLDKFLSEHEKRLQTVTDETQAMCEEQSDIIKCLAQLSTRIDKQAVSMEKMVTKNQNIVTNVQEYHTESMVDCDQTASELNTMTGGMTGQIKLHHEERNTLINDLLNDTFTDDINTTKTKMTDFSETAKLRLQEDCTQLTAAIDQHKEHVAAITDIVDQNQAITTSVASDVDRVSAYNKDQHTKATVAISQELEAMDKERCAVNDWCAQYKQTISHVEQLSTKYTGQDLRQDMPTGETPQRQDYTFPRTLTKTGRHSTLLKAFRREYMVEDALQEPIPQDSFTEEFPEEQTECTMAPPPFDFEATRAAAAIEDCGESTEYAVDNTDTRSLMSDDSAISSQSRTSALSAKDNVHKENVYQRSASKNVRSVTKNGPNSNGTPTKRGGDGQRANSTKKATAASGQTSKAKQRLPLRSNNP